MNVIESIAQRGEKTLFSFEILPPLKGQSFNHICNSLDPLIELNPSFINVTYHRQEYVYKKHESGLLEKQTIRKRPGTVGICAAIMNKYQIDTVPHIICGGFTKEETENALIDLHFLGINNVLALRGDPIKSEKFFIPEENGHAHADELIKQIMDMNKGVYLDENLENTAKTDFCIGVAGYPEKHYESPNLDIDLITLKRKQDLGASYIVTQLFFDNQKFFDFHKRCRDFGITIPIIPGLKPISILRHLTILPSFFYVDIPQDLFLAVKACKTNQAVREVGIEWSIEQSKALAKFGVPCLHYYSMGKSISVQKIAQAVF